MKQRTLGVLGGALLIGGVVLSIASGIAAGRLAPGNGPAINTRPAAGVIPRHIGPGQAGPSFGNPQQHRGFPAPGGRLPVVPRPNPSSSPTPTT